MAVQIQIFMPEEDHPSYGVVRAYVKDSLDPVTTTPNAMVYLDSGELSPAALRPLLLFVCCCLPCDAKVPMPKPICMPEYTYLEMQMAV